MGQTKPGGEYVVGAELKNGKMVGGTRVDANGKPLGPVEADNPERTGTAAEGHPAAATFENGQEPGSRAIGAADARSPEPAPKKPK